MKLNPDLWQELLTRANTRCEWVTPDGRRCQNTQSLHAHHRTYTRQGNELIADLSLLCPVHHIEADDLRRTVAGVRSDIRQERFFDVLRQKLAYIDPLNAQAFIARLKRTLQANCTALELAGPALAKAKAWFMRCWQEKRAFKSNLTTEEWSAVIWLIYVTQLSTDAFDSPFVDFIAQLAVADIDNPDIYFQQLTFFNA